ncbi:MAG TPA: ABC transporter substrate-binding protein [Solirubrobacterales bacterium]|jgi:polar amino acid transport system substrate-binding protein|nr:ABC transporter substrate-binding protein [Solirubrobacterales bacterium]
MRTRLLALLAAFALVLTAGIVAGCGDDDDDGGGTSTGGGEDLGLITDGQLLVGIDTPYPPFEIGTPPDVSGYDIEVMDAIADSLGVEPTYQDTAFDTIFRDVANGQFDIVAAASTITPERQQKVNFSDPYYEAQQALLVPEGSDIATTADLGGKIVGAQDATTGEAYANDQTDASEVRGFPEGPDATAALQTGQVDAVIIDQPVAVDAVEKQGGVEIIEEIPTNELYGFAIAPDNTALLEAVNGALVTIKGDGTLTGLYQKYFKTDPPASVLEGTTTPAG